MPTLKPFTAAPASPETGFQRATGESFGSDIGAGLISVGRGADELYRHIEEGESRDANVGAAQIRAKYAKLLDEAQTSGADTGKLKEDMETELAKIGENFGTRKGQASLEMHTANTNLMFDEQANRIAVVRASAEAQLKAKQLVDSDSATLRSNPSFLPMAEENARALVSTFNLSPEQRALVENKIIEQLNMAAVMSSVRIDPVGTKDRLEQGEWTLTPQQREQGVNAAEARILSKRSDDAYADSLLRRDKQERADAAMLELGNKILAGTLGRDEIMNDSDMSMPQKMALVNFQTMDRSPKANPTEMLRLWRMTHDPNNPNYTINAAPIVESANKGKIGWREANEAMKWVAEQRDENNRTIGSRLNSLMHSQERALSQNIGLQGLAQKYPTIVSEILMDYQQRVMEKVSALRAANDVKSLAGLFNPDDKDFVGLPSFMQASIAAVKAKYQANLKRAAAESGPATFPDGTVRQWNGQEPIADEANWIPLADLPPPVKHLQ